MCLSVYCLMSSWYIELILLKPNENSNQGLYVHKIITGALFYINLSKILEIWQVWTENCYGLCTFWYKSEWRDRSKVLILYYLRLAVFLHTCYGGFKTKIFVPMVTMLSIPQHFLMKVVYLHTITQATFWFSTL